MRRIAHISLTILAATMLLGACTEITELKENLPPETTLMVDSSVNVDPTHYLQVMHWHGEDIDGEVVRYEYKWDLDPSVADADFDTSWVGRVEPFVTWESDSFYLPVPLDAARHGFRVRAVDAEGLADPTPAFVELPVFNTPPILWAVKGDSLLPNLVLAEEILPVLSLRFRVEDPDDTGEENALIREFRFWFENPDEYFSVPGTDSIYTLMPEHFGEEVGQTRQFHLQAVDRGGARSNILAGEAFVKDVSQVELLILDSCNSGSGSEIRADAFWKERVAGLFSPEKVYVHDFAASGSLGEADVLHNIFSIFRAVIWYNGDVGSADALNFTGEPTLEIQEAEEALVEYLEAGGNSIVTGWNLIGASVRDQVEQGQPPGPENYSGASFSEDFESDILLLDGLLHHSQSDEGHESSNYRLLPGRIIAGFDEAESDSLRNMSAFAGIDLMLPNSEALDAGTIERLFSVDGDILVPPAIGLGTVGLRRYFDGDGELILLSFPLSLAWGYDNELEQVRTFLRRFGLLP